MGDPTPHKVTAGDRYGAWTVIAQAPSQGDGQRVVVRCDCGRGPVVRPLRDLVRGTSTSCGCEGRSQASVRMRGPKGQRARTLR